MARDTDGKPIETRGRRSISQKTRDFSDRIKGLGELFDGTPRLVETVMTGAFVGSLFYFLRPKLIVTTTLDPFKPVFRGQFVDRIDFTYPDRFMGENLAVLTGLITAPNIGGDIGSLIAPAGTAFVFKTFIQLTLPAVGESNYQDGRDYAGIFTDMGFNANNLVPPPPNKVDATMFIYMHYVIPRYLRALLIVAFFYIIIRFIRNLGPK